MNLDERLGTLKQNPLFEVMSLEEAINYACEPFRMVAFVKGTRTATCILRHEQHWVQVRVTHWVRGVNDPFRDGPWEHGRTGSRVEALATSRFGMLSGDFVTIALAVCAWAHEQKSEPVHGLGMGISDWGVNGCAQTLLSQVAPLNPGVDIDVLRTLAALRGHRFP